MSENKDILLKLITEKIADTDYSGYTFQYPPMFSWEKINTDKIVYDSWEKILCKNVEHLGIYVHIPFCIKRCSYCRYFSQQLNDNKELEEYLFLLGKEINLLKKYFVNQKIHSLYIGGGTPSLLNQAQIKKLFDKLYSSFNLSDCRQIIFEGNPNFLDLSKLKLLKKYGVSRLTIGVQSLDQKVIKAVNRFQTRGSFQECIKNARIAKIDSINVDLMVGLPQQNSKSFLKTLHEVINFSPDMIHIHPFYPTTLTNFIADNQKISIKEMERRDKIFKLSQLIIKQKGYKENKFDANSKKEKDVNIQLADAIEYNSSFLGLGAGAVSHITNYLRYADSNNLIDYKRNLDNNLLPVLSASQLCLKDEMIYFVISWLRYGKVDKKVFKKLFNKNLDQVFTKEINYLVKRKKIENSKDYLFPKFINMGEYSIFSKYFFDQKLILSCEKNILFNQSKKNKMGKLPLYF